jgi:hypothetical protein
MKLQRGVNAHSYCAALARFFENRILKRINCHQLSSIRMSIGYLQLGAIGAGPTPNDPNDVYE